MASKKMLGEFTINKIIEFYLIGNSMPDTGKKFNITTAAVFYYLKKYNIEKRTRSQSNIAKWQNEEFRENQVNKKTGKPSGALGKNWEIDKVVKRPNYSGENHHNWKGGKTELIKRLRVCAEYKFWRNSVFKRDNYTCQQCQRFRVKGDRVVLNADHKYPFSKIISDFNINTMKSALLCKELWDTANGITLCFECHKQTPTFGLNLAYEKN